MDFIKTNTGKRIILDKKDYPIQIETDNKTCYIHITGFDFSRRVMTTIPTVLAKTVKVKDKPKLS